MLGGGPGRGAHGSSAAAAIGPGSDLRFATAAWGRGLSLWPRYASPLPGSWQTEVAPSPALRFLCCARRPRVANVPAAPGWTLDAVRAAPARRAEPRPADGWMLLPACGVERVSRFCLVAATRGVPVPSGTLEGSTELWRSAG